VDVLTKLGLKVAIRPQVWEKLGIVIRRITLENFMSHARTVIELAEGLTVLIGPNNCGKSAVVEALRTLCENENGEHLVRHGAGECGVIVETDDGHTVAWRRKGGAVCYEIDGVPRDRLKGAVPENLHEILRLPKVNTGRDEVVDVHFGLQKSPVFLLHESACDRKAAAFFSSASDAEKLMQMQSKHKEKVRAAKARQRELAKDIARCDSQLERLRPLDEVGPRLAELEERFSLLATESQRILELRALMERMRETEREIAGRTRRVVALAAIVEPPNVEDEAGLAGIVAALGECQRGIDFARSSLGAMEKLEAAPAMEDARPLASLIRQIEQVEGKRQYFVEVQKLLREVSELPPVLDSAPLNNLIVELMGASDAATRVSVEVRQCNEAVADCAAEIRDYLAENPSCPVCGGSIDPETLFDQEHAHA
jgi:exonuclease SbcC